MRSAANGQNCLKRGSHDGDLPETPNKLTRLRKRQKVVEPPTLESRPLILTKSQRQQAVITEGRVTIFKPFVD
jgi:hypothetical protein